MNNIITTFAEAAKIQYVDSAHKALSDKKATGQQGLDTSIINILNFIIGLLGLVAVVVIILGGIGYMTSSGDAGKVKKAKDTILYGIIGLVICALAFAIVNFVIGSLLGNK